jgi:hypothetical protein
VKWKAKWKWRKRKGRKKGEAIIHGGAREIPSSWTRNSPSHRLC